MVEGRMTSITPAAAKYAAMVNAVNAQEDRIHGLRAGEDYWSGSARVFRFDPLRDLDANLTLIASYVEPSDVLLDIGGGAGRVSLPLARRCKEVINVEPSPGMRQEFRESAAEAGITNARLVHARWPEAEGLQGDVVFSADVTYFVADIVPFIQGLEDASRRRVILNLWSQPPPNRRAQAFELVYGEAQEPLPGHTHLLPVLWEMGILPDIRVMPLPAWWENEEIPTREEAVDVALEGSWLKTEDRDRAQGIIESHFDELFATTGQGFRPLWREGMRELLITWEPGRRL